MQVAAHHQRAVLTAATLNLALLGGGRIDITTTNMSCMAYGMAPDTGPGAG